MCHHERAFFQVFTLQVPTIFSLNITFSSCKHLTPTFSIPLVIKDKVPDWESHIWLLPYKLEFTGHFAPFVIFWASNIAIIELNITRGLGFNNVTGIIPIFYITHQIVGTQMQTIPDQSTKFTIFAQGSAHRVSVFHDF